MKSKFKIGIIQNAPITADLSANLRSIVQAYRDCIDRGAQLVVASAYALTGPQLLDLSQRGSFQQQNLQALETLAKEIAHAPLIVGSYSTPLVGFDDDNLFGIMEAVDVDFDKKHIICPFLLEDGSVSQLEEGESFELLGQSLYVEIGDEESATDMDNLDAFIRLSTAEWHAGANKSQEESRRWEAQINKCPIININNVGYAEGKVYGGGSSIHNAQGQLIQRLPCFEPAQVVLSLDATPSGRALPEEEQLLRQALVLGIRDYARNMGYVGVCLNLDLPNSSLLTLLCTEAVGVKHVHGISFNMTELPAEQALGITFQHVDNPIDAAFKASISLIQEEGMPDLEARVKAALINGYAEQEGLMLLSSLNRHQLLLGEFTLYAESCAKMLPFGALYDMDLYLLSKHLSEERPHYFGALVEPHHATIDNILHRTMDKNCSSNYLIQESDGALEENDVRFVQRRVLCSAEKRAQLPTLLHIEPKEEHISLPICHRLND